MNILHYNIIYILSIHISRLLVPLEEDLKEHIIFSFFQVLFTFNCVLPFVTNHRSKTIY